MPERYFFTTPYMKTTSVIEYRKAVLGTFKALHAGGIPDKDVFEFESGIYFEHDGSEVKKFFFLELPYPYPKLDDAVKIIPASVYECRQSYKSMVNDAPDFKVAIETEMFSNPYDLNRPLWELKVLK